MNKFLKCGKELKHTEGKRERKFCDNKNKCKQEYHNKRKAKEPKYVQIETHKTVVNDLESKIQKLLEKELIAIAGKSDAVGKPILYGTSPLFMDYFGINDINELPQMKDFANSSVSIGEQSE